MLLNPSLVHVIEALFFKKEPYEDEKAPIS